MLATGVDRTEGHWRSRRGLATEGEAPGAGLRSEASHCTFNVLVGAQPVPSIECSRSKLKHTGRQGVGKEQRRAREGQVCQRPATCSRPASCRRELPPHVTHVPVPLWRPSLRPSSRVISTHSTHGPFIPMDTEARGWAKARST